VNAAVARFGAKRRVWILLAPALVALTLFYFVPIAQSALYSLFDLRFTLNVGDARFLGAGNYVRALTSPVLWRAAAFTVTFAVVVVALDLAAGMVLALATYWVDKRFRTILRVLIIIPWAIPNVIQASIWRWLFDSDVGLIGDILVRVGVAASPPLFLVESELAALTIVITYVWKGAAISAIFCMAALATVPKEIVESAWIDGAGPLRRFVSVTLPMMIPVLLVALIFRSRDALRVFDVVYSLTGGGPGGSTETLSTLTYKTYFSFSQYGLGSAYAILSFLLIFSVATIYLLRLRREIHDPESL